MSAPKSELQRIADALERLVTIFDKLSASPAPAAASHSTEPPSSPPGRDALGDALADYDDYLRISKERDGRAYYYMEYEKGEAGRARWMAVNDIMKAHGWVWISAGKNSHWEAAAK